MVAEVFHVSEAVIECITKNYWNARNHQGIRVLVVKYAATKGKQQLPTYIHGITRILLIIALPRLKINLRSCANKQEIF